MTKQSFYGLFFAFILAGCAYFESSATYSTENVRKAELGVQEEAYSDDPDHYELHVISDSLILTDPNTGEEIYRESIDSGSRLANNILKDNQ